MTVSAVLSCLWVIASTVTALLPMKRQYKPGVTLLVLAPVLIVWLGYDYGWWVSGLGLLASWPLALCFVIPSYLYIAALVAKN